MLPLWQVSLAFQFLSNLTKISLGFFFPLPCSLGAGFMATWRSLMLHDMWQSPAGCHAHCLLLYNLRNMVLFLEFPMLPHGSNFPLVSWLWPQVILHVRHIPMRFNILMDFLSRKRQIVFSQMVSPPSSFSASSLRSCDITAVPRTSTLAKMTKHWHKLHFNTIKYNKTSLLRI